MKRKGSGARKEKRGGGGRTTDASLVGRANGKRGRVEQRVTEGQARSRSKRKHSSAKVGCGGETSRFEEGGVRNESPRAGRVWCGGRRRAPGGRGKAPSGRSTRDERAAATMSAGKTGAKRKRVDRKSGRHAIRERTGALSRQPEPKSGASASVRPAIGALEARRDRERAQRGLDMGERRENERATARKGVEHDGEGQRGLERQR